MADLLAEATQEPTAQDGRRRNRVVESSDEDDDQPQSKRSKRRRVARDAENEEEHEEREEGEHEDGGQEALDDLNGWTIATFADKPVGNSSYTHKALDAQRSQIKMTIDTLELHVKTLIEVGIAIEDARVTKKGGSNGAEEQQSQMMFEGIDDQVKKNLDHINLLKIEDVVLKAITDKVKSDGQIDDIKEYYKQQCERSREKYMAQSEWSKFKSDELYCEFRSSTWDVNNHDRPQPLMSDILDKGDDEDDSDIETGQATQSYKCPLTMVDFKDAHTSRSCKHTYEGYAIKEHILSAPGNARDVDKATVCPISGCNQMLKLADIFPNHAFQKKVDRHLARQEERGQEIAGDRTVHEII